MMTEAERLDFLILTLANGRSVDFAKAIGITSPTLSRIKKGELNLAPRISNILKAYPQVDPKWLMTGEGYPGDLSVALVKEHYEAKIKRLEMIIDRILDANDINRGANSVQTEK